MQKVYRKIISIFKAYFQVNLVVNCEIISIIFCFLLTGKESKTMIGDDFKKDCKALQK